VTHLAEVVTLYDKSAADIPAMLRMAADNIEAGDPAIKSMIAVTVGIDGSIMVYGWGETNSVDALATLQLAILKEGRRMLGDDS
jgi:hypothetical protein